MRMTQRRRMKIKRRAARMLKEFEIKNQCYLGEFISVDGDIYLIRTRLDHDLLSLKIDIRLPYKELWQHIYDVLNRAMIDRKLDM